VRELAVVEEGWGNDEKIIAGGVWKMLYLHKMCGMYAVHGNLKNIKGGFGK